MVEVIIVGAILEPTIESITEALIYKSIIILLRTMQILIFDVSYGKDPCLKAVEKRTTDQYWFCRVFQIH